MSVNNLKNKDSQKAYLPVAFGLQAASGVPSHSKVVGVAPNHQITAFNPLGVGEWHRCLGAFYQGEEIAAANYHFHPGALATGMTSGAQQVDSFFPKDIPHSGTAAIGYAIPQGLATPTSRRIHRINLKASSRRRNRGTSTRRAIYSTFPIRRIRHGAF